MATKHPGFDLVDYMIQWENGELDEADTIKLFQFLVDTGMVWTLQGMYGRKAIQLIRQNLIQARD